MKSDLAKSRRRLETSLAELRSATAEETGWSPRASRWALPFVAAAVGLVLGLALKRRLPRLGSGG